LLVRQVVDGFGDRVRMVVENWGASPLADRLGVRRYPAVFVNDSLFASPQDLGFFGDAKSGRYTPWRDPANHERFRADLAALLGRVLAGDKANAPAATPETSLAALPEFSVVDLDGRTIDRASLSGRPVLVEFWATWCPPCRQTLGFLSELKRRHGDRLAVVTFAVESEEKDVRELAPKVAAGLPVAIGTPELALKFGNLLAVPTLLLFDGDGKARAAFYGAPPDLHERVEKAMAALGTAESVR
jgi:thiol-disulfide isomerase/thioredoxin